MMECDKEEANRAKQIVEQKLQKGEYAAARRFAEKAQRLFPELENISKLLAVCEVHCLAENKLFGAQMDWYKILQIEQLASEAAIKKQYRKLALLLHPDKNKFAGAEAAFKLIGEANRVLADPLSRSSYDVKYSAAVKVPAQKSSSRKFKTSVSQQCGAVNNFPNTQFSGPHHHLQTFWTCCFVCNTRYEYQKCVLHCQLRCQNCQTPFVAYDMGAKGMAMGFSKGPIQNNASVFNQGPKTMPRDGRGANTTKKEAVDVKKEKEDVGKSKSDAHVKSKESVTSRNTKRKRVRQSAVESSKTCDTVDIDSEEDSVFQGKGENPAGHDSVLNDSLERRKSSRQKQGVSYNGKLSDDDDFESSAKKPMETDLPNNNASPTVDDCNDENSKGNKDAAAFTSGPEILEYPDPDFSNFEKAKGKCCFEVDQIWAVYDTNDGMPRFYARVRKVFSPGFKLRITWLEPNPDNQDEVEWCDAELPAACGKFKLGSSQVTEDLPMFSHQITWMKGPGRNRFLVYPTKGETWALFRNWDIGWRAKPGKHVTSKFEVVEVLSNFNKVSGITVAYLGKMKGFVSLFRRTKLHGVTSFDIPPRELFRFSHQIPSFKMTGAEREGVPEGSFELDPPSLPADVDEFYDTGDAVEKKGKVDTKFPENEVKQPVGSKQSSTPKKQKNVHEGETKECRRSPRQQNITKYWTRVDKSQYASKVKTNEHIRSSKDENRCNNTDSRENATSSKVDKQSNTAKKHEKNGTDKETLKSRKSPRALNKKSV